jgi:hypothetical protein
MIFKFADRFCAPLQKKCQLLLTMGGRVTGLADINFLVFWAFFTELNSPSF